jgi:hypothetical protein
MRLSFPALLMFLFSPVLALLYGLLQLRDAMSRNLIWFFCGFYGMAFYMGGAGEAYSGGADCTRYADQLLTMHKSAISLETFSSAFYQEGQQFYDVYQPILVFIVSRFTDDTRILFGLYGLVIGFFFSRVIGFFLDQCPNHLGLAEYGLLACLAFTLDIGSAINGVRMYTALFIFIYGFLYFWQTINPVYFVIACLSVLVHFSFIIPVAMLFALPTIYRFPWLVYFGFLGSFVFTAINIEVIRAWVESLPLGIESRVAGYLAGSDPDVEAPRILRIIDWMTKIFRIMACTYLLYSNKRAANQLLAPIVFAMALNAVINVLGEVGSMGRFLYLCQILIIGQLLLHVNHSQNPDTILVSGGIGFFAVLGSLLGFRYFLGYSSTKLLLANPFTIWFFEDPEYSLYEFMPKILTGL